MTISFIVGFLLFSSLHIVIGEQVPKTYAIREPKPVTLALAYPLHWFYRLVFPLNWLLDRANAGILNMLGGGGGFEQNPHITTLGGFVMQRLGRLPRDNDKFADSGYEFHVARMDGRQVHTVMISPLKKTKKNLDTGPIDGNTS